MFMLILVLSNLWIPFVHANISQELDPMVPVEPVATVTSESPTESAVTGQASNIVSTVEAVTSEKKEKSKKSSKKKSSSKKDSKSTSKKQKKNTKNS